VKTTDLAYRAHFVNLLEEGCSECHFDSEGELNYCDECLHSIAETAFELFVIQMECPEWSRANRGAEHGKK